MLTTMDCLGVWPLWRSLTKCNQTFLWGERLTESNIESFVFLPSSSCTAVMGTCWSQPPYGEPRADRRTSLWSSLYLFTRSLSIPPFSPQPSQFTTHGLCTLSQTGWEWVSLQAHGQREALCGRDEGGSKVPIHTFLHHHNQNNAARQIDVLEITPLKVRYLEQNCSRGHLNCLSCTQ